MVALPLLHPALRVGADGAELWGVVVRVEITAGADATIIAILPTAEPPVPVQVTLSVTFVVRLPVFCVPAAPTVPPQFPTKTGDGAELSAQDVALVDDQVTVAGVL